MFLVHLPGQVPEWESWSLTEPETRYTQPWTVFQDTGWLDETFSALHLAARGEHGSASGLDRARGMFGHSVFVGNIL